MKAILLSWVLLSVSASAGSGACVDFLMNLARQAKRAYVENATEDLAGKTLVVQDLSNGETVFFSLGDRIGTGTRGAIYRLQGWPGESVIGKLEKTFRLPVSRRSKEVISEGLDREFEITQILLAEIDAIEAAPSFPKNSPWEKGRFPVVPILKRFDSPLGRILVKPEVVNPIKVQQLALDSKGRFQEKVERGLLEIYQLQLAVHEAVPGLGESRRLLEGMNLDIGPSNLLWIEAPEDLERFGLRRPGFILFETDQGAIFSSRLPGASLERNHRFYPTFGHFRKAVIEARTLR